MKKSGSEYDVPRSETHHPRTMRFPRQRIWDPDASEVENTYETLQGGFLVACIEATAAQFAESGNSFRHFAR